MNTHGLSQLYDQLTPSERLPLIMAAAARDDEAEKQRLSAAAPEVSFRVPNYYPLAKALSEAVDYHLLTLLDLAAQFWQWWGIWMSYLGRHSNAGNPKTGGRRKTDADRLLEWRARGIARYFGSRFVAHRQGWNQFCSEMNIDPEVQLDFMIGWDTILRTDQAARELAFSAEEACQFVRLETMPAEENESLERGPVPVETVEELVEAWHKVLEHLVKKEGGP
jgi:hypothetical protein